MQYNFNNVAITKKKGIWPEGNGFWASDISEFTINAPMDGILSFCIALPKIKIHEALLPINVAISLGEELQCSREMQKPGSFRVQCSVCKGENLIFKIVCSDYIVPDDVLKNGDDRKLSVILRNLIIVENTPYTTRNYDFAYLVYSSHKTATQSIVSSLESHFGDEKVCFCHRLDDLSLMTIFAGIVRRKLFIINLELLIDSYYDFNNKPLKIISVYRNPESRLISSFFQIRGEDDVKYEGKQKQETIIYKLRDNYRDLFTVFNKLISDSTLEGYYESIDLIFNDLNISATNVQYDKNHVATKLSGEGYELHLVRFDVLINKFSQVLSFITGENIKICPSNLSTDKWYAEIHKRFKQNYQYPKEIKEKIFCDKSHLQKIFYGEDNYIISESP